MSIRETIEQLKNEFSSALEQNLPRFNRAILRELDRLWSVARSQGVTFEEFLASVERDLNLPGSAKLTIINELKTTQPAIRAAWDGYYKDTLAIDGLRGQDYARIIAETKIDYGTLQDDVRSTLQTEVQKAINAKYGYEQLRGALRKEGFAEGRAKTLANTSLSQFDNAYNMEMAQQGGIEHFKYDGAINPNTRDFCRERVGTVFTLSQIMAMDNGQGLPVLTSLGGYNCTHFWTAVL